MNDEHVPPIYDQPPRKKPPALWRSVARWFTHKFLVLYYVGMDHGTPRWAKVTLGGVLVYVFSLGILLDFLPPLGEGLDLGAVLLAGGTFLLSIRKHHLEQAREKTRWLFEGGLEPPPPPEPPIIEIQKINENPKP